MKRSQSLIILAFIWLSFGISSCQKAPELTLTGPTSFELSADGGSATINFTANRDWRVSSSDNWITVSPSSGTAANGTVAVTAKCNANTTYDDRVATVTISMEGLSKSVTIKQSANSGVLVPKTSYDISSGAQTIEVEVQKNINYTVEIEESCKSWIKKVGTKALTSEKIFFEISENTNYDARKGTITIIPFTGPEQTVVVNQAGKPYLVVSYSDEEIVPEGGTVEVTVKTNTAFDVTSEVGWIHYTQTKAIEENTVVLKVDKNEEKYVCREGTVVIKQSNGELERIVTVKQNSEAVDLGVVITKTDGSTYKLYWRNQNLGASLPEDYGDYYAWGETEPKEEYTWTNYKFYSGGDSDLTIIVSKYNSDPAHGPVDNKTILDPEDDAAHVNLGEKWRMPTREEVLAMIEQCNWKCGTRNGVNGVYVKSMMNSNRIFLPAAGQVWTQLVKSDGKYWTSSRRPSTFGPSADFLQFQEFSNSGQPYPTCRGMSPWGGMSIRPVTE